MTETDTSRSQLGDPPTDRGPILGIPKDDYDALLARAEKAEAERDTAWNGAIEAAAGAVREKWATQTNAELEAAILALRKGEPT